MARQKYPSDDVDKTMLRFPAGMREQLKQHAEQNNRSLNAEIIHRLKTSLASGGLDPFDVPFITGAQSVNAEKVAEILREALARVELLASGGVILDDMTDKD